MSLTYQESRLKIQELRIDHLAAIPAIPWEVRHYGWCIMAGFERGCKWAGAAAPRGGANAGAASIH